MFQYQIVPKRFHYLLVFIQFLGIFYFILSGSIIPKNLFVFTLEVFSLVIGIWAVVAMKLHTLTALPSVKKGGKLCTTGPYRVIRHPMYTAVLLLLFALLLNNYAALSLMVLLIVFIDLIIKINIEEKILEAHYSDYRNYMSKTKRIIPFLY